MTMSVPLPAEFFGKVGKKHNSQSEEGGYGAKEAVRPGLTRRQSGDKFMTLGRRARWQLQSDIVRKMAKNYKCPTTTRTSNSATNKQQ